MLTTIFAECCQISSIIINNKMDRAAIGIMEALSKLSFQAAAALRCLIAFWREGLSQQVWFCGADFSLHQMYEAFALVLYCFEIKWILCIKFNMN
jgi:hypothetical protein